MHRLFWWVVIAVMALMMAPLAGLLAAPVSVARPAPAMPDATQDDEIILLTSAGQIRIDDPLTPAGIKPAIWNSASDAGWTMVAAGDFNGDGDAEIVAAHGDTLKMFDPVVQPGKQPAVFGANMGAGRNIRLLVTGDFDGDGKDEIAVTFADNGARLRIYDGGATAAAADWKQWYEESFDSTWKDMAAGDFNNDGYDDLALVRNVDRRIMTYKGGTSGLSVLAEKGGYGTDWLAVAGGNVFSDFAGDEIALDRNGANAAVNGLLIFRVVGNAFVDIGEGPNYKYNPNFTSLALGDLNGDGDDEILLLRDPVTDKASLFMVNPAGQPLRAFELAIGFGAAAWKLVRTGDIDGDGRDEVVVERGDGYRVYAAPEANDAYSLAAGPLYTTSIFSNLPTMAVANVDGPGLPLGPELSVSPKTLSFNLEYRQPSPTQNLTIKNTGTSDVIAWQAKVIEGSDMAATRRDQRQHTRPARGLRQHERGPAERYPLHRQDSHRGHGRRNGHGQPDRGHRQL